MPAFGVAPLASAAALGASPSSRYTPSPPAAVGQSAVQLLQTPTSRGQGQGASQHSSRDEGGLSAPPLGGAGAMQMVSPVRERRVSPANKLTDLQKQNDALRFKPQVPLVRA